jgi:hypothetical protein
METKKAVVFLGELVSIGCKQKINPNATGFIIKVDVVTHLVTAKHVVVDPRNNKMRDDITVFLNTKGDGKIKAVSTKTIREQVGIEWIFHANELVDIAMIPFPIDIQNDDVMIIPEQNFLDIQQLAELYNIFFLSFQPGVVEESKINPITRVGVVSRINEDSSFYIDAPAFPGNSGSPVFITPSAWRFGGKGIVFGADKIAGKFIGIIGEYITHKEIAISTQTSKPRVIFEENTGISKVWSVNHMNQIIQSQNFKDQLSKIKLKAQSGNPTLSSENSSTT